MKYFILIGMIILLCSCATEVTKAGRETREIDKSLVNSCIFISDGSTSSVFKFGSKGNYETVRNNIRNITAERGGNAYTVNDFIETGPGHFHSTFEIYKCPETKYQLSNKYRSLGELKSLKGKGIITQKEYEIEKTKLLNAYK